MKKTITTLGLMLTLCTCTSLAQAPSCNNDNGLEGRINAIEASGWVEISRSFTYINYLVAPETPYLVGTVSVVFGVACEPGEACPEIARLYKEEAIQVSDRSCVWQAVRL